jgi:cell division protein FtsB
VRLGQAVNVGATHYRHKDRMVARTRLGRILQGLALHVGAALIIGYFAFQGYHGDLGLLAQRRFEREIADLTTERDALRAERAYWEHRVALLRPDKLDPDLVEELARRELSFAHARDLVFLGRLR